MKYKVNDSDLQYNAEGQKIKGEDRVLLHHAIDITAKTSWHNEGYTISKLFDTETYRTFIANTRNLLLDLWRKAGLPISNDFRLENYHTLATTKDIHLTAVEQTKLIGTELFPINIRVLEELVSTTCHEQLIVKNPFDNQSIFHFRVIRPGQHDNNPLHRDVWLDDYKDCINLYIPIVGSNEKSSLIIIPESHRWPESKIERTLAGAEINGVKFNVPAVTGIDGELNFVRPNPKENEVLIFSPYLIHGGAANLNNDVTRISIEIRLWKK